MTDQQALEKYAATRDAQAFRVLVEQYQRLVYSAAARRLARAEDIEDVAQLTFIKLARAAGAIRRDLSAWLYTTAINGANDLIRRDQTRRRHEALAAPDEIFTDIGERENWDRLSLLIDELLVELPAASQYLILEHFLRGRSQRDLAEELNVSQPTVLRRINAAVNELRDRLTGRGCDVAAPLLAATLEKLPQQPIPHALTGELAKVGLAGVSKGSIAVSKTFAAWMTIGACTIVLTGVIAGAIHFLLQASSPVVAAPPSALPSPTRPPTTMPIDARTALNNAYALQPGQNLRFIPPPPLPERQQYFHEIEHIDAPMPCIEWRWINGHLKRGVMQASGPEGASLSSILSFCLKLEGQHISMVNVPPINCDGDWIVRDDAAVEPLLSDLHTIVLKQFGTNLTFEKNQVMKDALIVTGKYHFQRIAGAANSLQIYSDVLDHPGPGDAIEGGGTASPAELWKTVGGILNMPLVDESTNEPREIHWLLSRSVERGGTDPGRQQILDNITKQTGVIFKKESRPFITWKCIAAPSTQRVESTSAP